MSAFVTDTDFTFSWRMANGYCTSTDAEVEHFESLRREWKDSLRSLPQSDYAWRRLFGLIPEREDVLLDRDAIRERVDFARVLELYGVRFKRRGDAGMAVCPFHSEKTASMSVHFKKKMFNCMACGAKGDLFGFVMRKNSIPFYEAMKELDRL